MRRREETLPHQRALTVASVGIETIANDWMAIADHIRNQCDNGTSHFGKIDVRILDRRVDEDGFFTDFENFLYR